MSSINSIHFQTSFRSGGNLTNPSFILNDTLNDIVGVKVKSAMIPLSFYTFDTRNQYIYFVEGSGSTLTAIIPSGIYTSSTLPAVLQTAMNGAVGATLTYTITYSAVSNKLTFTASLSTLKFVSGANNAYYELGIISTDLNAPSLSITPSQTIDLSGVKVINFVSNISGVQVINKNFNVLCSIICEDSQNSIQAFRDDGNDYINTNISSLSDLHFNLYDEFFRVLTPLKDFSITVNFQVK